MVCRVRFTGVVWDVVYRCVECVVYRCLVYRCVLWDVVYRCVELSGELCELKLELKALDRQLLDAVSQKLQLSEQLEAWQVSQRSVGRSIGTMIQQ